MFRLEKVYRRVKPLFNNHVADIKKGFYRGIKLKGEIGFIKSLKETKEHSFLESQNFNDKTIYDIGAYVGALTLYFSRKAGPFGKIYSFEPFPENYNKILNNIELNNAQNVKVFNIGIGNSAESKHFTVNKYSPAESSFKREDINSGTYSEKLPIDTLDNLFHINRFEIPDFIKIDVEGYEYEVLLGAVNIIDNYKPQLFLEIHEYNLDKILDFLFTKNYMVFDVENGYFLNRENALSNNRDHLFCQYNEKYA